MGGGAGKDHECDPEGARFFDGGRAGAAAGSGRDGVEFAGRILRAAGGGLPGEAGSLDPGAGGGGVSVFSSAGSLLRDDGYFSIWI